MPPESEVEEILLLKPVKSALVRRPRLVAEAEGILKVMVFPAAVTVKSVPVVEEAMVTVPVCVCPAGPTARTPVFVTFPPEYARPEENVVVATHVGTPFTSASVKPFVPWP